MKPRRAFLVLLATLALALAACGVPNDGAGGGEVPAPRSTERVYQVRGVLQVLPAEGSGELRIRHEAIPDFVDSNGNVSGMMAMTMPFPLAADLDLTGFAPGDAVSFELTVDWEAARPVAVTAMEKLPADSELALD